MFYRWRLTMRHKQVTVTVTMSVPVPVLPMQMPVLSMQMPLYRMMQRKYDVVPGQRGSVGESKTTLESSLRSAGLPVPQDVRNISINYNTLGNIKNWV